MPSVKQIRKFLAPTIMVILLIISVIATEKNSDSVVLSTLAPISTLILMLLLISWVIGFRSHQARERRPTHRESGVTFPHDKNNKTKHK